ncbi:MAG: type 11 methyltransferase [Amycolatopsis sp.]|uniref:class I SAM-dependent methyltransferase n=1 Tax=Amycolatopsis sp. TaxID=37632 RepID=UPI00261568F0|nr:class I SAM-dependent methyltransferase [Amycolatopsis sp.]MCU1687273.1 type 11 methyltransferase [Amycolatopsis sp.]
MNEPTMESEQELRARRAGSFGAQAAAYAEHRPDYPVAALRWALDAVTPAPKIVLDLAAGTGKLTAGLVELGLDVTAVEPDTGMLAELSRLLPSVTALEGQAERIPLPDASVDAVFVGQAFHWFDVDEALAEIARVLRPGGVLLALWNRDDESVPWVAGFKSLTQTAASASWTRHESGMPESPAFGPFEESTFPHAHRRTAETLVETVSTQSHMLVADPADAAETRRQMAEYLAAQPETSAGEFDLPLQTMSLRATRR